MLKSVLGAGFTVQAVSDRAGMRQVISGELDAFLYDIDLHSDGQNHPGDLPFDEILERGLPVIILADDERRREALDLVDQGAHGCIRKPPLVRELKAMLRSACKGHSFNGDMEAARPQLESAMRLDQLIGSSADMHQVYKLVRMVAGLDASVLITGESGTGKELVARAIHNLGSRAKRPFVAVACGAIPETLVEAELFGHEKGAFTGSSGAREGYFETAGDGTLFLDEIGELNAPTQVKLLRVLQQREFSRLGSSRSIPLRARVVFATHRNLEQMVADGAFRKDLFYRINVMKICAPALREHAEDIPLLAHHFLRQYSGMWRKPVESIEPEALAMLQNYPWPGNVRELENAIQHSIIVAEGRSVEPGDLPEPIREQEMPDFDDAPPAGSFELLLRDYKFKLANEAVQQCNGNKTLAAQSLSISRAYLHRLLRQAGAPSESGVTEIGSGHPPLSLAAGG
jgi:DNA-binding NtrC family response regulator